MSDVFTTLVDPALLGSIPRFVTPILLAALGGALCQRAGVFNIALEGMMLGGAFAAVAVSYATESASLGLVAAALAGAAAALLFAAASVWRRGDAIVISIALNILLSGLTAFALRALFDVKGSFDHPRIAALPTVDIPLLADIPVAGALFADQSVLVWLAALAAVAMHLFLVRHPLGLRLRGVGEHPAAARSLGVSVGRVQAGALLASGVLCGIAGAQLAIGTVSLFVEDMTAGRGWIAVVAVMLGGAHPLGVALAALLFGFADSLSFRVQGLGAPQQLTESLPYVVTLATLILAARGKRRGSST